MCCDIEICSKSGFLDRQDSKGVQVEQLQIRRADAALVA
jgi:hypothetical protein